MKVLQKHVTSVIIMLTIDQMSPGEAFEYVGKALAANVLQQEIESHGHVHVLNVAWRDAPPIAPPEPSEMKKTLRKIAAAAGLSWDEVKDMTLTEFAAKKRS